MDIREKINAKAYASTIEVPPKPREPQLAPLHRQSTAAKIEALDAHKARLLAYEADLAAWKLLHQKSREDEARLLAEFKDDLIEELGINFNPKRDLLFDKAWERGHSSGLDDVLSIAEDLVELIQ